MSLSPTAWKQFYRLINVRLTIFRLDVRGSSKSKEHLVWILQAEDP